MNTPSLFDQPLSIECRNDSYHSLAYGVRSNQLSKIKEYLKKYPMRTSRQIALATGIERTSVCRVLKENENDFVQAGKTICKVTKKPVTVYANK